MNEVPKYVDSAIELNCELRLLTLQHVHADVVRGEHGHAGDEQDDGEEFPQGARQLQPARTSESVSPSSDQKGDITEACQTAGGECRLESRKQGLIPQRRKSSNPWLRKLD